MRRGAGWVGALTVAALAVVAAGAVAACGSGNGDRSAEAGGPPREPPEQRAVRLGILPDTGDPRAVPPAREIRETLQDIQADFPANSGSVCSELSQAGQEELAAAGLTSQPDCGSAAYELSRRVEPWYSEILSIDVNGRRASALVREADDQRPRSISFVDEGRGWRLVSLWDAEPVAEALAR